jgi:hypothetical protein
LAQPRLQIDHRPSLTLVGIKPLHSSCAHGVVDMFPSALVMNMVAIYEDGYICGIEPPYSDEELEKIIAALVKRKWAPDTGDAECAMLNRVLNGLRYRYEEAGPIWESLDDCWHANPP